MILSNKQITKALIRLRGYAGWSAPSFFTNPRRQVFSHMMLVQTSTYPTGKRLNTQKSLSICTGSPQPSLFTYTFILIWFFTSQSTVFQLCRDGSSWVEPVLSKDKCVLLKVTCSDASEARTCNPSVSSQALYHWATSSQKGPIASQGDFHSHLWFSRGGGGGGCWTPTSWSAHMLMMWFDTTVYYCLSWMLIYINVRYRQV